MTKEAIEEVKIMVKKQKIPLLFPYAINAEVKKLGARWDVDNKIWYFPSLDGKLPEELEKYKKYDIDIEYDDKEYYKNILKSMKWDKNRKKWSVNQEDYDKFLTYTEA